MERLQKRIATSGYCSRRKAEELIQKGLVEVNGEVITKLGTTVKPGDIITVEGNILDNSKAYEYYLLNKPKGVVTTTNDEKGRNTVIDLIETNTRIYPVGRLDYDTTGALILTNDGNLANLLMRPDSQVDKTYIAKVKGIVQIPDIQKLRNGIIIDGVKTKKASVRLKSVDKKKETSTVVLTIHEGKNRERKGGFYEVSDECRMVEGSRYPCCKDDVPDRRSSDRDPDARWYCGLDGSWQCNYRGRRCIPRYQPCRSAGAGEGG